MAEARPLSTLNQSFLFLSTLVNGNSCELIELAGTLDPALLEQAIRAALARHPVLNSRLCRRLLGYVWQEAPNELPLDLRLQRLEDDDADALHRRLVANVWDEPLDLYAGRPLRVHLTEAGKRSFVQLVTTHVWSDARAGYRLAADIAAAYGELSAGRSPRLDRVDVPDRDSSRLLAARLPRWRPLYWLQALGLVLRDLLTFDRSLTLPSRRGPTDVQRFDLGPDPLARLRHAARCSGVTVHALMTVALLRACQTHDRAVGRAGGGTYRLLDLFSLRSFAQVDVSDLYDTLVVPFSVRLDPGRADADLVAQVARDLKRLKGGDILVELFRHRLYAMMALFLPKRLATRLVTRLVVKGKVVGTNPGPVPFPIDAFGPVPVADFYSFSQLFPPGRVMCIFSTFRGDLRLIVVYDREAFQGALRERFVEPLLDALHRLTREAPGPTMPEADALSGIDNG